MTDAVRSLVPIAFKRNDIVRLQAGIFSNNPASMRVLEKCGFIREAVHSNAITKNGTLDEVMYVYFGLREYPQKWKFIHRMILRRSPPARYPRSNEPEFYLPISAK